MTHGAGRWAVALLFLVSIGVIFFSQWPLLDFVIRNTAAFIVALVAGLVLGFRLRGDRWHAAVVASLAIFTGSLVLWLSFYATAWSYGFMPPVISVFFNSAGAVMTAGAALLIVIAARGYFQSSPQPGTV